MLQVAVGICPNCGDDLWAGSKLLDAQERTIMVINCHKCNFYWPANVDIYYDLANRERDMSPREIVVTRLQHIIDQIRDLFGLHQRLKSVEIVSQRTARGDIFAVVKPGFRATKSQLLKIAKQNGDKKATEYLNRKKRKKVKRHR